MPAGMAPDPYDDAFRNRFLGVGKNRGVLKGIFYRFKGIFLEFRDAEPGPRAWKQDFQIFRGSLKSQKLRSQKFCDFNFVICDLIL
jgi:hypothetical protein